MEQNFGQEMVKGREKEVVKRIKVNAESRASDEHPGRDEDSVLVRSDGRLAAVFDGVGGEKGGEVASRIACEQVEEEAAKLMREGMSVSEIKAAMKHVLNRAHAKVMEQAQVSGNEKMATTASVVYVWEGPRGEKKVIVGNVGDSRVYRLRDGEFQQITIDDSKALKGIGDEQKKRMLQLEMNEAPGRLSGERNIITQALGRGMIEPRIYEEDLREGDVFLICSDGVSDNLKGSEISRILQTSKDGDLAVRRLLSMAHGRSKKGQDDRYWERGKPDDMTAAVIEVGEGFGRTAESKAPITLEGVLASRNMMELRDRLLRFDGIQGSQEYFTGRRIEKFVGMAIDDPRVLRDITNAGRLRERVIALRGGMGRRG